MRYLYLLLALLTWPTHPAAAQTRPAALFPFTEYGRWGFLNSTGAVVMTARFAQVKPFSEGRAAVREGGYYGFIDATGRFVVPPTYDYVTPFHGGLAVVAQGQGPLLIDRNGHRLPLPAPYRYLSWQPGLGGGGV